jgi:hypothetical protein
MMTIAAVSMLAVGMVVMVRERVAKATRRS